MTRYIDAEALERAVSRPSLFDINKDDVIALIVEQPAADVEEVRHGEWTKSSPYNRFMNCSSCGFGQNHTTFNYCPNCGAKMDGERREK